MKNIVETFIGTWVRPFQQFQRLKEEGLEASIKSSVLFVLTMGVISGIITAIIAQFGPPPSIAGEPLPKGMVWLSVLLVPAVSVIGSFLGSGIVWVLVTGALNGTMPQYKSVYRVLATLSAFSPVSSALSAIPTVGQWLAVGLNLWGIILMIFGIIAVLQTKPVRTAVVLGVVFGILFSLGIAARIIAERQNQFATPDFADLNATNDDTVPGTLDDEQLNKELEALAEKAKEEAKNPSAADSKK